MGSIQLFSRVENEELPFGEPSYENKSRSQAYWALAWVLLNLRSGFNETQYANRAPLDCWFTEAIICRRPFFDYHPLDYPTAVKYHVATSWKWNCSFQQYVVSMEYI